ncbi:MAG: hypothetical protein ACOCP8_05965 [archaeon]
MKEVYYDYPISEKFIDFGEEIKNFNNNFKIPIFYIYENDDILSKNYTNKDIIFTRFPQKYELPKEVEDYFIGYKQELKKLFKKEKCVNFPKVRLHSFKVKGDNIVLNYQKTHYFNSFITNLKSEYELGNMKIRNLLKNKVLTKNYKNLIKLNNSQLSNHLGYDMVLFTKDGKIIFPYRSENVAIIKNNYSSSASGSLEFDDVKIGVLNAKEVCKRETKEELNLNPKDFKVRLYGINRMMQFNGKPNLSFIGITDLTEEEFLKKYNKNTCHETRDLLMWDLNIDHIKNFKDLDNNYQKIQEGLRNFLNNKVKNSENIHLGVISILKYFFEK